jgi:MarR family transcriptional regulator for hemolysin
MKARREAAKPVQIGPNEFRIGFYVHDVSRMRRTLFDHEMKPLGITRSQWWALAQLSRSIGRDGAEGMLQTELARILDVGKVTVGGLVDRLEVSGFVRRKPDKIDRRAKRIVITKQGHDVLDQMIIVGRRLNLDILDGISERDVKIAERVLSKMKANIRDILAPLRLPSNGEDAD